ncbi:MAG TPA: hypothetical protein QGF41_10880 [Gammaproteobacteria bacterium]|nr:hypothetical protein [Gammaproteobacteria bacterium]
MKSTGSRKNSPFRARHKALRSLGMMAPNFSVALDIGMIGRHDFYLKLPFRRSAVGILISGGFLAAFSIPLFTVGSSAFGESDGACFPWYLRCFPCSGCWGGRLELGCWR